MAIRSSKGKGIEKLWKNNMRRYCQEVWNHGGSHAVQTEEPEMRLHTDSRRNQ